MLRVGESDRIFLLSNLTHGISASKLLLHFLAKTRNSIPTKVKTKPKVTFL